jgi:hypothetical protein
MTYINPDSIVTFATAVGTDVKSLKSRVTAVEQGGSAGPAGESAYQVAVDAGFNGSQSAWLASLVGPKGADGTNGTNGVDGKDGTNGTNGIDGTNGTNGVDGKNGNTMWPTSGVPSASLGVDGDFANDVTNSVMYGPKASGTWPAGVSYAGTSGASGPTPTLRNIATRCRHNYQTWTTAAYGITGVSEHINQGSTVTGVKVKYGNWYANNVGEFTTWTNAGSITYSVSIEYPIGTFTLCEWGTQTGTPRAHSAVCPLGQNVVSDSMPVTIPHGAKFKLHVYMISTAGTAIIFPVSMSAISGPNDTTAYWSAALANDPAALAVAGTTTGSAGTGSNFACYPLAVLGMSNVPSVMCIGDSRLGGYNDSAAVTLAAAPNTNLGYWGVGEIGRSLDYALPYANFGCPTDTALTFSTTHTLRAALQSDHTHVHCEYGINDIVGGAKSFSQVQGYLNTIYALFPTKKVSQSTISPKSTSTDSFATSTNQTTDASNGQRTALNDWIRTTPAPLVMYFDVADAVESSRNSGLWRSVGDGSVTAAMCAADGLHETPYGYNYIRQYGAINTALFT